MNVYCISMWYFVSKSLSDIFNNVTLNSIFKFHFQVTKRTKFKFNL